MDTLLFCVVTLAFLCWVLILKHEIEWLKKENRRLTERLARQSQYLTKDVEVSGGRRLTKSELALADQKALQTSSR